MSATEKAIAFHWNIIVHTHSLILESEIKTNWNKIKLLRIQLRNFVIVNYSMRNKIVNSSHDYRVPYMPKPTIIKINSVIIECWSIYIKNNAGPDLPQGKRGKRPGPPVQRGPPNALYNTILKFSHYPQHTPMLNLFLFVSFHFLKVRGTQQMLLPRAPISVDRPLE